MVKKGYKETEIGIIPEDWDVKSFGEIFTILPNNTFSRAQLSYEVGTVKNIHYGDVLVRFGCILDCKSENLPYVNENHNKYLKSRLQEGDLIFADTAEDKTVGKAIEIINVGDSKIVSGLHTIPCRAKESIFAAKWLGYYANHDIFHDQLSPYITGIKVSSISKAALQKTLFVVPPMQEQKEIAQVLYDMDKLILSLEKLIEKKKAIKKTLLQKMFPDEGETTPELRLPGFTEAWEQRKLEDIVEFLDTMRKPLEGTKRVAGPYPYYGASGIVDYVDGYLFDEELILLSEDGANITDRNYPICFLATGRYWVNNHAHVLRTKEGNENNFICNSLEGKDYNKYNTGMAMPKLNQEVCRNITVYCPSYEEQKKIGDYLRNLDNLITLHQRKLEKYRKIKQGMMQKLLTGDIRLSKDSIEDKCSIKNKTISVSDAKEHNQPFDDAVVISGIVDCFYSPNYRLGRKKVQKLLYLLRRHQEADISSFKKKAAGPYADEIRYKGGEPIAVHNGYIVTTKNNKGTLFTKGKKITDALEYLRKWNQDGDLQWLVRQFKYITTDNLELLATIDMAMCDLETEHIEITIENLKKFIKSNKEWKNKLSKSYFSEEKIKWAIEECNRLFR